MRHSVTRHGRAVCRLEAVSARGCSSDGPRPRTPGGATSDGCGAVSASSEANSSHDEFGPDLRTDFVIVCCRTRVAPMIHVTAACSDCRVPPARITVADANRAHPKIDTDLLLPKIGRSACRRLAYRPASRGAAVVALVAVYQGLANAPRGAVPQFRSVRAASSSRRMRRSLHGRTYRR
jgi:hypothetical protein